MFEGSLPKEVSSNFGLQETVERTENEEAFWPKSKSETACDTRTRPKKPRLANQKEDRLTQLNCSKRCKSC